MLATLTVRCAKDPLREHTGSFHNDILSIMHIRIALWALLLATTVWGQEPVGTLTLSNGQTKQFFHGFEALNGSLAYTQLSELTADTPSNELPNIGMCKFEKITFYPLDAKTIAKLKTRKNTLCDSERCSWRPADVKLADGRTLTGGLLDVNFVTMRGDQGQEYPLSKYRYKQVVITKESVLCRSR
jgi:hypothetical protein